MVNRRKGSFTLIEMLAVMGIIAILAGILLPILTKVRQYSKRAVARDICYQVATAWKSYLQDYRKFPALNLTEMNQQAIDILGTTGTVYNKTQMYLEFNTNELARGGMLDPWGGRIQFALDNGISRGDAVPYDGKVRVGSFGNVYDSVAVWSKGEKNGLNGTTDDESDDVRGW